MGSGVSAGPFGCASERFLTGGCSCLESEEERAGVALSLAVEDGEGLSAERYGVRVAGLAFAGGYVPGIVIEVVECGCEYFSWSGCCQSGECEGVGGDAVTLAGSVRVLAGLGDGFLNLVGSHRRVVLCLGFLAGQRGVEHLAVCRVVGPELVSNDPGEDLCECLPDAAASGRVVSPDRGDCGQDVRRGHGRDCDWQELRNVAVNLAAELLLPIGRDRSCREPGVERALQRRRGVDVKPGVDALEGQLVIGERLGAGFVESHSPDRSKADVGWPAVDAEPLNVEAGACGADDQGEPVAASTVAVVSDWSAFELGGCECH